MWFCSTIKDVEICLVPWPMPLFLTHSGQKTSLVLMRLFKFACGVDFKPDLGDGGEFGLSGHGTVVSFLNPLSPLVVLLFNAGEDYKFRQVHQEPVTLEATWEVSASEATSETMNHLGGEASSLCFHCNFTVLTSLTVYICSSIYPATSTLVLRLL
ncbi:hypothetical protein DY000_02002656 [Brassica cretica]|uniref:Uncharacterized protein n=1 Tax=Brassica cretica TaxID=69181 RepID=A0ABQ7CFA2_BRACR|nr:hypothetical protein DY000_02002656 [Brassica cretica]